MKLEIKRSSLMYKFLRSVGCKYESTDICQIAGIVLTVVVLGSMLAICTIGGFFMVGDMLAWVAFCVINWTVIEPGAGVVIMIGLLWIVVLSLGVAFIITRWQKKGYSACQKVYFKD